MAIEPLHCNYYMLCYEGPEWWLMALFVIIRYILKQNATTTLDSWNNWGTPIRSWDWKEFWSDKQSCYAATKVWGWV